MEDIRKKLDQNQDVKRNFGLSTLSVNNSISVFILVFIIVLFGYTAYNAMPKEQFPEVVIPTVYINTPYPGNSPVDIENLITRPIEKELKGLKGIKKINSTSAQDYSVIIVEFNEDVEISRALQDVKDAVDKSKKELPSDLDQDPLVQELDVSEIPISVINLSGDFEIEQLNNYAEWLEDELEALKEVSSVNISGNVDREIQINADLYKMQARNVTFDDIAGAVANENVTISGGNVKNNGYSRSLRVDAEFDKADQIADIIIKSENGNPIYLKDVAVVEDTYVDRDSYARLATGEFKEEGNYPVVSLQVVKRNGENLIDADRKINELLDGAMGTELPESLKVVLTDNQADNMNRQIDNLENSIISGVILVVLVLLFFMGLRNAMFVGIAIPLSMFMSFVILGVTGNTINIMVLFALILALGMLVDNAIVVIENIYRLMEQGMPPKQAAKEGVGEVAVAIISSTATTLAAFLPLAFWGGIIGEFMKYLPITLIIVLSSSLLVGLVINPVIAYKFMKVDSGKENKNRRFYTIIGLALITVAIPFYFINETMALPNLMVVLGIVFLLNAWALKPAAHWFQNTLLVRIENLYLQTLRFALMGIWPYLFFFGTVAFLIVSTGLFQANMPLVVLFPDNDPDYVYVYAEAAQGTDVDNTDGMTQELEQRIFEALKPYDDIVKSVVTNVGRNTGDPAEGPQNDATPHKAKISIGFVDFEDRNGIETGKVMKEIGEAAKTVPGFTITTGKNSMGPPVGKPINIEVTGEDYDQLLKEAEEIKGIIEQAGIPGIDGLKLEVETGKPELLVKVDRDQARRYGVSTMMLATSLRTSIYGKEVSKFKDGDEDHPIQLRLSKEYRNNTSALSNQRITFRDKQGNLKQVPISAVADLEYTTTFGSVKRKDLDRLITVSSNVTEGYNPNEIVAEIKGLLAEHEMSDGYQYKFTGEQEEQAESLEFLSRAMLIAVCAIFMILVSQFNSFIKPFIIIASVIFSLIGVLLGLTVFGDQFVIIMTGVGIISLAGVVVNNAIVLIDYIDLTRQRKKQELGMAENEHLSKEDFIECLIKGGYTRLRPVLLTAITTVLGLIPLAIGFNIDFYGLFAHFEPAIYWGGQNADFWGPMAWTVIYGLVFATFLTLVIVPVMYLLSDMLASFFRSLSKKADKVATA